MELQTLRQKRDELEIELLQLRGWYRVPGEYEAWSHTLAKEQAVTRDVALSVERKARYHLDIISTKAENDVERTMLQSFFNAGLTERQLNTGIFGASYAAVTPKRQNGSEIWFGEFVVGEAGAAPKNKKKGRKTK